MSDKRWTIEEPHKGGTNWYICDGTTEIRYVVGHKQTQAQEMYNILNALSDKIAELEMVLDGDDDGGPFKVDPKKVRKCTITMDDGKPLFENQEEARRRFDNINPNEEG